MQRRKRNYFNLFLGWIDRVSLGTIVLLACASVVGFALVFWRLTAAGGGLSGLPGKQLTFKDCLYFSIVTFTSLGYGDIAPISWGRVFASAEVLLGLSFLGVAIAKLSSARQSYYLGQLYARNAQENIRQFVIRLRELRARYVSTFVELKGGRSPVPSLSSLHLELHALLSQILSYLTFEIQNGDFLGQIPKGPITRLLHTCAKLVPSITAVSTFRRSLHSQEQRSIAKGLIRQITEIGELVKENTEELAMASEAMGLLERCSSSKAELQRVFDEVAAAKGKAGGPKRQASN